MIDERCTVITPVHQAANRLREAARGSAVHGTCGQGIGEAVADSIDGPNLTLRAGELSNRKLVTNKLSDIAAFKREQLAEVIHSVEKITGETARVQTDLQTITNLRWIDTAVEAYAEIAGAACVYSPHDVNQQLQKPGELLFEGAQGALLDQDFGFHPHTTWSKTTTDNAIQLLIEAGIVDPPRCIGVLRSYMTRHGAGPLVTEDQSLRALLAEPHNADAGHQGNFRVGVFDAVAARYAISFAGVNELAITHLDYLPLLPDYFCHEYSGTVPLRFEKSLVERESLTRTVERCKPMYRRFAGGSEDFLDAIQLELKLPIGLTSHGPTADAKKKVSGNRNAI